MSQSLIELKIWLEDQIIQNLKIPLWVDKLSDSEKADYYEKNIIALATIRTQLDTVYNLLNTQNSKGTKDENAS